MAVVVRLQKEHLQAMIDHALADAPVECCGVLAGKDGNVASVERARNREGSPYRFSIDPLEFKRLSDRLEEAGLEVLGTYHSHTGSEAVVSPTDIRMLGPLFGPPYCHFVIGVKDRDRPVARVWQIENADRVEQAYELVD